MMPFDRHALIKNLALLPFVEEEEARSFVKRLDMSSSRVEVARLSADLESLSPSRGRGKVRGCGFHHHTLTPTLSRQGRGSYWTASQEEFREIVRDGRKTLVSSSY